MSHIERQVKKIYVLERFCSTDGSVPQEQEVFTRLIDALQCSVNIRVAEYTAPFGQHIAISNEFHVPFRADSATGERYAKFNKRAVLLHKVPQSQRTALHDSIEQQIAKGGFGPDGKDAHVKEAKEALKFIKNALAVAKGALAEQTMFLALNESDYRQVKSALYGVNSSHNSRFEHYANTLPGCEGFRQSPKSEITIVPPKAQDTHESAAVVEYCRHKLAGIRLPYNAVYLDHAITGLQKTAMFVRKAFTRDDQTQTAYLLNQACDELDSIREILADTYDMMEGFEKTADKEMQTEAMHRRHAKLESERAVERAHLAELELKRRNARNQEIARARENGFMWG